MSTIFSSKSSGGAVVPPRRPAIPNILPCPADRKGQRRALRNGEPAVHVQGLAGHVVAGPGGKEHGDPVRPVIVRAAIAADRSGSRATCALSRVGTNPGHTELQHTPEGAHASDCDRVSAARPPLDAP